MGKKTLRVLLCLFVCLALTNGCKKKESPTGGPQTIAPGESLGDLRVLAATPRGATRSVRESQSIVAIFDRPMAALEALLEGRGALFLKIDPRMEGKHRWLGSRALTFIPDKPLPLATEFRVTVPAGTRSLEGYASAADYSWTFETVRPHLLSHFPRDEQKSLDLETKVLLIFNQPVDKSKAKDFIVMSGLDGRGAKLSPGFSLRRPAAKMLKDEDIKDNPENILLLEPSRKLVPDATYTVEVRSGLPGQAGPLGSEESATFSFETYRTFDLAKFTADEPHVPYKALQFEFTNPVSYKNFAAAVKFDPAVEIPESFSEWEEETTTIWADLPLEPETSYTVRLAANLHDRFGNALGRDIPLAFRTSPLPPSVSMTTGHGVLEAYGDLRYPLSAVNTEEIGLQAAVVKPTEVVPLLTLPRLFWPSQAASPWPGFYQVEKPVRLSLQRNKRQTVPLDISSLLPDSRGYLFLQVDSRQEEKWSRYQKVFLQVTELGVSAKFSPENNAIWTTELKTGLPAAGVEVEIRGDDNVVRFTGTTDERGILETPGWRRLGIKGSDEWSKPQQWVFVKRGRDAAFTSSEWGTGIYPYRFGIEYDWDPKPETMRGSLFTERGIYRAGETVHVKGILRTSEKGRWQLPPFKEVNCEIQDPFQKSVLKTVAVLDAFGSFDFDVTTGDDAPLGYYQILVKVPAAGPAEKESLLSDSFRVEAFRPAEFEVHLRTLKDRFVFGEEYQGEIRASYLFGGAMAGQKASWRLRLNPAEFAPPGYEGYTFGNSLVWEEDTGAERSRLLSSGESVLDAQGMLAVKVPLVAEKEKDSVMAALEATVESPSRRSVSNRIQTIIHRGEFSIGLRPSTGFLKNGDEIKVDVLAVNPEGTALSGKKVALKLFRREWRSVRKAGVGGRFSWETEKEDVEIASHALETKSEPVAPSFKPDKSGLYFFSAEARDGLKNPVSTTAFFYVAGKDYVSWERRDDDTIELVADKDEYRPGERARILVKSPYEKAKALITVERELVLDSRVVDVEGSSNFIEIPLSSDHVPNVFVSVLLIQGRVGKPGSGSEEDAGRPSFKIGYVEIPVNPSEKQLAVEVRMDRTEFRPHDKATIKLAVKDSSGRPVRASVSLAVADVGVLNLIGYRMPDPFSVFYAKKLLSVQTSESRLHVVGQREYGEKGEEASGAAAEGKLAAAPSLGQVELRSDFKSTAYWNPSLATDGEGRAEASFDLPGNLTSFRIMAVAQTADSLFGRGESTLRVSKPLQLLASAPRFARAGDRFEAGVVVHNLSSARGDVVLELTAEGIVCNDATPRRTAILPGEAREILFPFEASLPGMARLSFRAKMGEEKDGLEARLPVSLPRPLEAVALFGEAQAPQEEEIRVPENSYLEEGRIDLQAASTALAGLRGGLDYLKNYPYLCLEQRVSSILPYLVAWDVIRDFGLSPMSEEGIHAFVKNTIRELYGYQKESGGFGLWPDSSMESPFNTCYAVFALLKASASGYEVEGRRIGEALDYLRRLLKEKSGSEAARRDEKIKSATMAFALYDLALASRADAGAAEALFRERTKLPLFGKTLLLKALHTGKSAQRMQDTLLAELLNLVKVTPSGAHFEEDNDAELVRIYSSTARTTALILQAVAEVEPSHPLLPQVARWLVEKTKAGSWRTTQESMSVIYALNEFYKVAERVRPDFRYSLNLEDTTVLEGYFRGLNLPIMTSSKKLSEIGPGPHPLRIIKDGEGTLYYGARMFYAPREKLPPRDEGMALAKTIQSLDGRPLTELKAGSLVIVTLDLVLPRESLYVVVEDPLPAGLEAVNPTFLTESEEEQRNLEAIGRPSGEEGQPEDIWWEGFNHIEMRDDRVLLFADVLGPGLHSHRYLARVLTPGIFVVPGTRAEEMYAPEVFGRTAEMEVRVVK